MYLYPPDETSSVMSDQSELSKPQSCRLAISGFGLPSSKAFLFFFSFSLLNSFIKMASKLFPNRFVQFNQNCEFKWRNPTL